MTATFRTTTLGSHVDTQKGFAFKSKWYSDTGRPIVKVSDFTEDSVDVGQLVCVPEEIAQQYLRYELREGDVVVQTVGSWPSNPQSVVGKAVRIPRVANTSLLNQNAVKLEPDKTLDNRYLFYLLRSAQFKNYIVGTAQGAASQAAITLDSIRNFVFKYPDLTTQRKIAAVLSAYDDLIENNLRRIKIIEEMAQTIYREWFLKFRFSGHEKVKMVDSELGKIPEGWNISNLFELAKVRYGKNLPGKALVNDGLYPVYGAAKIIGSYVEYTRRDRTIITGCRGSVGDMQITKPRCFVTNNAFTFDPENTCDFFWLFHALKERGLRDVIGGAAQPQITLDGISSVQLLTPPLELREQLHDVISGFYTMSWNLEAKNENLCHTRDLLLPKLISGQLDVSDLDIKVDQESA